MARRCHYAVLLLTAHYFSQSLAQRNITVDDTDPSFIYTGQDWEATTTNPDDMGGSHHVSTDDPNANAKFTFTGVAVYFMAPLWPYHVGTQVQLDGQTPMSLNLTNPNVNLVPGQEFVKSAVIWSSGPIANTTHTLTISKNPNLQFVIVDAIVYTVLDPPPITPPTTLTSSSTITTATSSTATSSTAASSVTASSVTATTATSSSTTSSTTRASTRTSNHVVPIAVGTVLGVFSLLVIAILGRIYFRKRKRTKDEN